MELLVSGVLSLASVAYFRRLAARPGDAAGAGIPLDAYKIPDVIFASILALWFILNVVGSGSREIVVNVQVLILNAIFSFLLIICLFSFLILRSVNPLTLFGLTIAGWRRSLPAFLPALLIALPAIFFIHALSFHLLGAEAHPQPLLQFLNDRPEISSRLLLAFTAIVVAPVAEEVIFRGYIYGTARKYAGRWWALAISAVIFAVIHAHLPSLGGLLVLAVALTLVYEFTASLWAPILMHALFNSLTVVATLLWPGLMK